MSKKNTQKLKFEEAVEKLETIVARLEEGEVPLDESLTLFEEGVALSKHCGALLDQATQKVSLLTQGQDGEIILSQFEPEDD